MIKDKSCKPLKQKSFVRSGLHVFVAIVVGCLLNLTEDRFVSSSILYDDDTNLSSVRFNKHPTTIATNTCSPLRTKLFCFSGLHDLSFIIFQTLELCVFLFFTNNNFL